MATDLTRYGGELLPSHARSAGRSISRYHTSSQVRVAKVDADADVAVARGDAYTAAAGNAMGHIARVAQGQRALEQLAPEASARLNLLADEHALTMAEMLTDLRRDLRRW